MISDIEKLIYENIEFFFSLVFTFHLVGLILVNMFFIQEIKHYNKSSDIPSASKVVLFSFLTFGIFYIIFEWQKASELNSILMIRYRTTVKLLSVFSSVLGFYILPGIGYFFCLYHLKQYRNR